VPLFGVCLGICAGIRRQGGTKHLITGFVRWARRLETRVQGEYTKVIRVEF